jgi:sugar phosphate isomerase/epimerase
LRHHRLDTIELRMVRGQRVPVLDPGDRDTLQRWVRDEGIRVRCVSPGLFKGELADSTRTQRELSDTLPRSLELANALQAPFVIAFGFENPTPEPLTPRVADTLRQASEACERHDATLLLENEPGFFAQTAEDLLAIVRAVDHPAFGLNWDPLNSNHFAPRELEVGLRAVFPWVRHVHVKNGKLEPGQRFPRYGPLSAGDLDWPAHLRTLQQLDYQGCLGIETHFEPLAENSARLVSELRTHLAALR